MRRPYLPYAIYTDAVNCSSVRTAIYGTVLCLIGALRLKPDDAVASRDLGNAYYSLKQYPDAALAYKQAIRLKPDYADAHYWLGLTYFEMGKKDEALQIYRKLLTIDREQAQKLYAEITKAR